MPGARSKRCFRSIRRRFPPKYIENTFKAIPSSFRSLEMHSKRRYKTCIWSVILGDFEYFRNFQGFSIIFPKILDAIYRVTNARIFPIPISITFLNPNILDFLFLRKTAITRGVKCEKLSFRKSKGNLSHKFRKLYVNGTVI